MNALRSIMTTLLMVFLLLPGHAFGAVLCFGADGHISLEASQNGRCGTEKGPRPLRSQEHTVSIAASADHCGPCVDVPLLTSDSNKESLRDVRNILPKFAAPVLMLVAFVVPVSTESLDMSFLSQPAPLTSTLLALRTTVLLL
jgi:hypothetical protein